MNLVQRSVLVVAAIWICRVAEGLVAPGRSEEPVPLAAFGLVVLIMLASVLLLGGTKASAPSALTSRRRTAVRALHAVMAVGFTAAMVPAVAVGVRTGALPVVGGWTLVAGNVAMAAGLAAAFLVAGSGAAAAGARTRWQSAVRLLAAFFGMTAGLRAWRGLQVCAADRAVACPSFVVPAIVCAVLIGLAWRVGPRTGARHPRSA